MPFPDCSCGVTVFVGHPHTGYPHAVDCPFRQAIVRAHATSLMGVSADTKNVVDDILAERMVSG